MAPDLADHVKLAYRLAKEAHRGQLRESGNRYFEHVRAVALILTDECKVTDHEMLIAALFHDIPEDQEAFVSVRALGIIFDSERLERYVDALTKRPQESPEHYYDRIRRSDVRAIIIKLADRLHNVRDLWSCGEEKRTRKIKETIMFFPALIDEVRNFSPDIADLFEQELDSALKALG